MKFVNCKQIKKTGSGFFKDKDGKIVIVQHPNAPIIIWFVGLLISKFTEGSLQEFASFISFLALLGWAGLEVFSGVSYFRRTLGVLILIFTIYNRIAG